VKLLLCAECQDVVKLQRDVRRCRCGKASGRYLRDGLTACFWGDAAYLIGLVNQTLVTALCAHVGDVQAGRKRESGHRVEAFIIPEGAPTTRREAV